MDARLATASASYDSPSYGGGYGGGSSGGGMAARLAQKSGTTYGGYTKVALGNGTFRMKKST